MVERAATVNEDGEVLIEMGHLRELDVERYLVESVQITPEAIQEEYVRVPADFAYWNARYSQALRVLQFAKMKEHKTQGILRIKHRERLLTSGVKVTESQVDAAVEIDPDMEEVRVELIEAEVEKVHLQGVLEAVKTKREMLVSLGAHIRLEMASDPTIRREQAAASGYRRG